MKDNHDATARTCSPKTYRRINANHVYQAATVVAALLVLLTTAI